jgi:RNA polymerase-binding transcription factor DksA
VFPDLARTLLDADRRRTTARLRRLRAEHLDFVDASRDSNADDEHDPEGATIAFERSQVGALTRQAEAHLVELDAALARVEDGTYGTCERCGSPVPDERLQARPTARACITCP